MTTLGSDPNVSWNDVMKYSEVIDRLLPGDIEVLAMGKREKVNYQNVDDGNLRLVALGLMVAFPDKTEQKNQTIVIAENSGVRHSKESTEPSTEPYGRFGRSKKSC